MVGLLVLSFLFCNFVERWYLPIGRGSVEGRIFVGDTDRDGNYELFIDPPGDTNTICVYELYLPNTWYLDSIQNLYGPEPICMGDFDLDDLCDIAYHGRLWNGPPINIFSVLESADSFSYPMQEVWRDTISSTQGTASAYDVDGDGVPEIFFSHWVYESVGDNQYALIDSSHFYGYCTLGFGDFDDDGKIELVGGDLSGNYWIYESPANNIYECVYQNYLPTGNIFDCFSVPDMDGDGKLEFVVKGFAILNAEIHAFIFEAIADNTYEIIKTFILPGGDYYGGWSDVGDVDGDGVPEIALEALENVFLIKAAGNDSFYLWQTLPGNVGGSSVVVFDLDENGFPEIIISGGLNTHIYEYEPTGVEEIALNITPHRSRSLQVYPNPFHNKLDIKWEMVDAGLHIEEISLKIYDICGRPVKSFATTQLTNSSFDHISWDGKNNSGQCMPPGVYFVHLENHGLSLIKKITKCK
jgi:hypothetical protein